MSAYVTAKQLLGFLPGNAQSHPGKKLLDHLNGTCSIAEEIIELQHLEDIKEHVTAACLTHDYAKADPLFQEHLKGAKGVEHSAPSSFFTLVTRAESMPISDIFFAAEAVRRHHTHIENWNATLNFWMQDGLQTIMKKTFAKLAPNGALVFTQSNYESLMNYLYDMDDEDIEKQALWLQIRMVLSVLVGADRMDAINLRSLGIPAMPQLHPKTFKARGPMDTWRNELFEKCMCNVSHISTPAIYTLTLPTGAGKTNIGINAAYKLIKKFNYDTIIYAMPFISIIEQNTDYAKSVFGKESVQEDHSLSLFSENNDIPDDSSPDESQEKYLHIRMHSLFRYWNEPVVVTTMVHLWEVIFSPKASLSMNFHRLRNAVVIIDEPQSMSCRFWDQFGAMIKFLNEQLGTIIILMTATQPCIGKFQEIAPKVNTPVCRHNYTYIKGKSSLPHLLDLLQEQIDYKNKSGMIVLNTKKSAWITYRLIKSCVNAPVFFLSRWMTAEHRRRALKEISDMLSSGSLCYVVATQVVEAGIDLDFDWVLRDIGPLDSIIQAAGRCNRSGLREEGKVLITECVNEKGKSFADMVYDKVILEQTKGILEKHLQFKDTEVSALVSEYYENLVQSMPTSSIWEDIKIGKWNNYQPLWNNSDNHEVTVYIDSNHNIDSLIQEINNIKPSLENRESLKKLQNKLDQCSIGVALKEIEAWRESLGSFISNEEEMLESYDGYYVIKNAGIGEEKIYHPVAGFQPKTEGCQDDF